MSDQAKPELVEVPPQPTKLPKEIAAPKAMPEDIFEYGQRLCAVYQKGWADCQEAMAKIYAQKELEGKKQASFW